MRLQADMYNTLTFASLYTCVARSSKNDRPEHGRNQSHALSLRAGSVQERVEFPPSDMLDLSNAKAVSFGACLAILANGLTCQGPASLETEPFQKPVPLIGSRGTPRQHNLCTIS